MVTWEALLFVAHIRLFATKGAVESHTPQATIRAHLIVSERFLWMGPSPDFTRQAQNVARC